MGPEANQISKRGERNISCPFYNGWLDYAVKAGICLFCVLLGELDMRNMETSKFTLSPFTVKRPDPWIRP